MRDARPTITLCDTPSAGDLEVLREGMRAFELEHLPQLADAGEDRAVVVLARGEDGQVCGGLEGCVFWGGFEIEMLWVTPALRGRGLGSRVLARAEAAARRAGAGIAYLRTVRARRFYEGHGYRVFGELEDRPPGSVLLFMKKRLEGS